MEIYLNTQLARIVRATSLTGCWPHSVFLSRPGTSVEYFQSWKMFSGGWAGSYLNDATN